MSTKFWSRPRGVVLLGAAACAACCAPPIAAIVVGAGAASTIAAIAEPIAGVLLAAGTVLGIAIYLRRRKARAAERCGCDPVEVYTSPDPSPDAPIACTVDLRDGAKLQAGMNEYRAAFTHLASTERTSNGFRWHFRAAPGLETQLKRLATAEHACCSFMKFEVTVQGSELVWETTADASARSVVEEYMRLPEMLRAGRDVKGIKDRVTRAGLTFTSDAR
jgi:hypothetical protein